MGKHLVTHNQPKIYNPSDFQGFHTRSCNVNSTGKEQLVLQPVSGQTGFYTTTFSGSADKEQQQSKSLMQQSVAQSTQAKPPVKQTGQPAPMYTTLPPPQPVVNLPPGVQQFVLPYSHFLNNLLGLSIPVGRPKLCIMYLSLECTLV